MKDIVLDEYYQKLEKIFKDYGLSDEEVARYFHQYSHIVEGLKELNIDPKNIENFFSLCEDVIFELTSGTVFKADNNKYN